METRGGWRAKDRSVAKGCHPQFIDKVRDIVGLYLTPPEAAVALCVDEKTQVQALDRTAPVLPLMPGVPSAAPTVTSATASPTFTPRST